MYHSITFGNKNTWNDWHLIPTSRPVFGLPSLKKKTLDIQGGDGILDLTEALTGYPLFNNREGSFEFIVMDDHRPWYETYSMISNYLHGQRMKAVLEDEPEYYYEGRFTVNSWKSEKSFSKITIDYSVAPYKKKFELTEFELNGRPDFVMTTISRSVYGYAPVSPKLHVSVTNGCAMQIKFINDRLGIDIVADVNENTLFIPEMIMYGESVKIGVKISGSDPVSEDSNGEPINDNLNELITSAVSGSIRFSCSYGGI